jgi:tetratricopeptide (TPR) repeat protein
MNTAFRFRSWAGVLAVVAALVFVPRHAVAQDAALSSELLDIQHAWEKANYETRDPEAKKRLLEALSAKTETFAQRHPNRAEPLVWEGIVLSTYAGARGGLGALSLAKKSRDCLLQAVKLDPDALDGSAYTSLGALFYKVPGWPVGFGSRDKAAEYLRKALSINPEGMDPNYFFGELMYEEGDYAQSLEYLQKALDAPSRPDRPLADAGRRVEISTLIAKVRARQSG